MGHTDNEAGVPHYWGKTGKAVQLLVTVVATTDFLLFGYDQGVMSGIVSAKQFLEVFPPVEETNFQGFVVSIYAIGCFIGALFIMLFGDKLGRRYSIFLGASVMIIGVIIQVCAIPPSGGSAGSMAQFIVGRCITGVGNGINTSTVPTYQAECSHAKNRGRLICIEGGNVAIGTLIAYWIDYGCTYGPDAFTWRFPIAFQCVFAVIVLVLMIGLPESPRWLLTHDRHDEAATIIAGLNGVPRGDPKVVGEMNVIKDAIRASGQKNGSTPFSALFTGGKTQHFRRLILGASSQMMQQLSGCNAVIYYFPILFKQAIGTSEDMSLLMGGVNMIVYAIFATTSWFFVERVGRRKLFLYGTVGQCLSMVITFACLIPGGPGPAKGAAVGLFLYIGFFGATWLPLPWLYPAEINPLKTRAKANATSTVSNWLWNFFIVMVTPVMLEGTGTGGFGTYLFFAAINAVFFPIIYFTYPETAGRSLEEIDVIFAKGFSENISYVKAAKELPFLDEHEVHAKAREYGFGSSDDEEIKTDHAETGNAGVVTQ